MRVTAVKIVEKLQKAGYQAYLTGGCVRDLLLNKEPHDYDIATSARPEEIENLFEKTFPIGKEFGVVLVRENGFNYEIATFRSDSPYSDGRRPNAVIFSDPRQDALRRDFTINALFLNPLNNDEVIDFVGGQDDLRKHLIRFVGDPQTRVEEDHLRLLRAVRLKNQINGQYHPETYRALQVNASLIKTVAAERTQNELNKILLSPRRVPALQDLFELGMLVEVLPELVALKDFAQPYQYHREGSVWEHTLQALGSIKHKPSLILVWAVLLHDIAKPATFTEEKDRVHFHGHSELGGEMSEEILRRFKFPRRLIEKVRWLVEHHMLILTIPEMPRVRQLVWWNHPWMKELLALWRADLLGTTPHDLVTYREYRRLWLEAKKQIPKKLPKLISGEEVMQILNLPAGPRVGEILAEIKQAQLLGEIKTKEEAKEILKKFQS